MGVDAFVAKRLRKRVLIDTPVGRVRLSATDDAGPGTVLVVADGRAEPLGGHGWIADVVVSVLGVVLLVPSAAVLASMGVVIARRRRPRQRGSVHALERDW